MNLSRTRRFAGTVSLAVFNVSFLARSTIDYAFDKSGEDPSERFASLFVLKTRQNTLFVRIWYPSACWYKVYDGRWYVRLFPQLRSSSVIPLAQVTTRRPQKPSPVGSIPYSVVTRELLSTRMGRLVEEIYDNETSTVVIHGNDIDKLEEWQ